MLQSENINKQKVTPLRGVKKNIQTWALGCGKAVNKAGAINEYKTHWHKTNQDADYLTHEGEGNRWKQSGIRDDIRPGTQEEGQGTWNERGVALSK